MSTAIHLCTPDDLGALAQLCARRHEESGTSVDLDHLTAGLGPLAAGGPEGSAYLFGPPRAPVGYCTLTFAWSVAQAAYIAQIDDIYIRPSVRHRGIGSEVLAAIFRALRQGGISRLVIDLPPSSDLDPLLRRFGFTAEDHRRLSINIT